MKEKTVMKRCLALLLAIAMVVSGLTIPKGEAKVAEAVEETESATNVLGDTTADDAEAEARIGDAYFTTFVKALEAANNVGDVTITLLKNITITNASITKKLTIDGDGHEITTTGTADTFKVEVADVVEFQNMNIKYQSTGVAIRIVDNVAVAGADVRLTNVDIASTADVGWTLINILPRSSEVTTKLTLDTVHITMDTDTGGGLGKAIIRTGNGSNKVLITANNSVLDTSPDTETETPRTGAVLRHAIAVVGSTEAEINLTDTELHTRNALPIYDASNAAKIHKTRCSMSIADTNGLQHISATTGKEEAFSETPVAQIGNTLYSKFADIPNNMNDAYALKAANNSQKDVTIDLLADVTVQGSALSSTGVAIINNTSGKSITIDGNNHHVATKAKHAFSIRYSGEVNFRNMKITHYGEQTLFQVGAGDQSSGGATNVVTLNIDDVKVDISIGSSNLIGAYGVITTATSGKTTLNLTRFNVTINDNNTTKLTFNANEHGVIRTGNQVAKEVKITLNDCTWNVSGVNNRNGILVKAKVTADITINDSTIITGTGMPIYTEDNSTLTVHKTRSTFTSTSNVARIGNVSYATFEAAYTAATAGQTIELLQDITLTAQFTLGKGITIDGNNHTVNTRAKHAISITHAGAVKLCNMIIDHKHEQSAIQINATAQLTMTDVDIQIDDSTSTTYFHYGIINVPVTGTGIVLDFTRVDVKMKTPSYATGDINAVLRTGNNSQVKEIAITLTDCNWNVTEADHRMGIAIMQSTKATVVLNNSQISTLNEQPIYVHAGSTETTVTLQNGSKVSGVNSVAQSGYKVYDSLQAAINDAKDTTKDVLIELMRECTIDYADIYNANSKNITIDGKGYTLTTSGTGGNGNVFRIYGSNDGSGTYELKNMNLIHKKAGVIIQVHSTGDYTTKLSTVKLSNMDIKNAEDGGKSYGLFTTLPSGDDVDITLDMNNVDVTMAFSSENITPENGAIIRTGNPNAKKNVNINLTDCNFDTTKANGVRGIFVLKSASANIMLNNTTISTMNKAAIEAAEGVSDSTITIEGTCAFDSEENEFKNSPIRGYDAQVGNVVYYSFAKALTAANTSTKVTTIKLLNDVSFSAFTFNNAAEGFAVTINGDNPNSEENYTITTTGGTATNAFTINYPGVFELKNLDIKHKNSGSVLQISDTSTVNMQNVYIDATEPSNQATADGKTYYDTYTYALINILNPGTDDTVTLDFNNVDVDMVAQAGAGNEAILRTGNNKEKTVDITLTDCNWDAGTLSVKQTITTVETSDGGASTTKEVETDVTGAVGRAGIRIMPGTAGEVKLINSVITTLNTAPIYNSLTGGQTVVTKSGDWKLNCVLNKVQVNNNVYASVATAISEAQKLTGNVSIELLQDVTVNTWDIYSKESSNVTLDGNNHEVTTAEEKSSDNDNAFRIYGSPDGTGTYALKNMNIVHTKPGVIVQVHSNTTYTAKNATIDLSNIDITTKKVNDDETIAYGGNLYGLINTLPVTTAEDSGMTLNLNDVDVVMEVADDVLGTDEDKAIIRTGNPGAKNAKKVQVNLVDCYWDIQKASGVSGIVVMDTTSASISMINSEIITKDTYVIKVNNETGLIAYTLDKTLLTSATAKYERHPVYNTDGHKVLSLVYEDFATYRADAYKDDTYKTNGGKKYFEKNGADAPIYEKPANILEGSLFGGWYTNADMNEAVDMSAVDCENSVYAKLVPEHVMSVKAQISQNLIDGDDSNDSTGTIRFVTTVDSLKYQEMGFRYSIDATDGRHIKSGIQSSDSVYTEIYALEENGEVMNYHPSIFCTESTYFKTLIIENVPAAYFDANIMVQPFWITLDGTIVWGEEVTKTVQEGIDKTGWQLDNTTPLPDNTTAYTNRVILVSDLHYTTEQTQSAYNSANNLGGWLQKKGASIASGTMLGYTQANKLLAALTDIDDYSAAGNKVDSVLVLGDLTTDDYGYRGLKDNGFLDDFKSNFMDIVTAKYGSCYALPGNHDSQPENVWNSLLGTNLGRQYSIEIGDAVFIMLDTFAVEGNSESNVKSIASDDKGTDIDDSGANYSGIDVAWLSNELDKIDDDKTIFLCSHRYTGGDSKFAELVSSDKRIVCMFEGHTHKYNVLSVGGVLSRPFKLVNVGTYSYKPEAVKGDYSFESYNTFDEAYAWGYQVLEWNDSVVHTYHVRNARTYTAYDFETKENKEYNYKGTIENEIFIRINK